jgi:hypothetical protein
MGYHVPLLGPPGRLVWRDADSPSRPPPDESALDACIPGRAAIRDSWSSEIDGGRKREARARGIDGAAKVLREEHQRHGSDPGHAACRDRVQTAKERTAARKESP